MSVRKLELRSTQRTFHRRRWCGAAPGWMGTVNSDSSTQLNAVSVLAPHQAVSVLGLVSHTPHRHNDRDQANTLQRQGEGRDLPADPGACGQEV